MRRSLLQFVLLLSWASPALADGSGATLALEVPVIIDDANGCNSGKAPELAKKFCADFDTANLKGRDKSIKAVADQCLVFYESALRIQNVFCSYQIETAAVATQVQSTITGAGDTAGNANVSQVVISKANHRVSSVTQAYMDKIKELAPKFRAAYDTLEGKVGKMNGFGGADEFYEATCSTSLVSGTVPGIVRELLATATQANASVTYSSIWGAVRQNMQLLRAVKTQAEENAKLTQTNAIDVGTIFQQAVEAGKGAAAPASLTPIEGAISSGYQYLFSQVVQKALPKIPVGVVAVAGAGMVVAYQIYKGQYPPVPETTVIFVALLNPAAGIASGFVVAVARTMQSNVLEYRSWAQNQLASNLNLTAMQLVDGWGRQKNRPACVKNAAAEASCIEQRKTMQAYDTSSCSQSPIMNSGAAGPLPGGPTDTSAQPAQPAPSTITAPMQKQ